MPDLEDRRGQLLDPMTDALAQADYFRHLHPEFDQLLHSIGIPRAFPTDQAGYDPRDLPPVQMNTPLGRQLGSADLDKALGINTLMAGEHLEGPPVPLPKPRPRKREAGAK